MTVQDIWCCCDNLSIRSNIRVLTVDQELYKGSYMDAPLQLKKAVVDVFWISQSDGVANWEAEFLLR